MRKASRDPAKEALLPGRQGMFDEQIPIREQVRDLPLEALLLAGGTLGARGGRTPAFQLGLLVLQLAADLSDGLEDLPVDFLKDVELTDLMGNVPENVPERLGIQRRTVGGAPPAASGLAHRVPFGSGGKTG